MATLDCFDIKGRSALVTGAASGIGLAYAEAMALHDCQAIALLHNSTSPRQRELAVRWLAGYEQSLRELSAQR